MARRSRGGVVLLGLVIVVGIGLAWWLTRGDGNGGGEALDAPGTSVEVSTLTSIERSAPSSLPPAQIFRSSATSQPPSQGTAPATATNRPSTTTSTTTTTPVSGGFTTPEDAVYTAFGFEDVPAHCNDVGGWGDPCFDPHGFDTVIFRWPPELDADGELVTGPVYYWVHIEELPDGTFDVLEIALMEGEHDLGDGPPWWDE